jgi:hypothetical protein
MKAVIAALAGAGLAVAGILLYIQPDGAPPESGLGLNAAAEAPAPGRVIREAAMARPKPVSAPMRVPTAQPHRL